MAQQSDPLALAGMALVATAIGGGIWYVMSDEPTSTDRSSRDEPREQPREAPAPPSAGAGSASPASPDARDGWIPAGAREIVRRSDLPSRAEPSPSCQELPNPIEMAKRTVVLGESQLRDATRLSDEEEAQLGDRLEREAPQAPPFRGKWDVPGEVERWQPYLQDLVDHLARHTERKGLRYRVHVIRDDRFNAFALPGGVMAVHTGVLAGPNAVRDEAELVAVLGHELAHVERRHPVAAYQYAKAALGTAADEAAVLVAMLKLPIQSEYEYEADARGIELAAAAQYDPDAAHRLWQRMAASEPAAATAGDGPGGLLGAVLGSIDALLSTHPPNASRCHRAALAVVDQQGKLPFERYYRGASNVRERTPGPRRAF
ncbi:MAG: hypothetical protein EXR79_16355 [Myxococcales bacterium]|nr:hypothetical protein [Myxococcales bacterium]